MSFSLILVEEQESSLHVSNFSVSMVLGTAVCTVMNIQYV